LPVIIPEYLKDSHPFSSGRRIFKYRPDDLKKFPSAEKTERTDWFEKRLLGIWLKIDRPVPYAFCTKDGNPRSIDAGSLAYLFKRKPRELETTCDTERYIIAVEPTDLLRKRYAGMESRLIADILPATDGISTSVSAEETSPATEPPQATGAGFASSLDFEFDIDAPVDERRREESRRAIRDGARQFRRDLLEAWGAKCAITGTSVIEALDGAHIYPYLGTKTNLVVNGVLLRADLHRLFDRYLIKFCYDERRLAIQVSKKLAFTDYSVYSGRRIELPAKKHHRPAECFVAWHYRQCERGRVG